MLLQLFLLFLALPAFPLAAGFPSSIRNGSEADTNWRDASNTTHRKWLNQVMLEVLPSFVPHSKSNQECNRQTDLYRLHLSNLTLWAVTMYESSAIAENGALSGNEFNMGNFDECIQVSLPDEKLVGKYCLPHITFRPNYFDIDERQSLKEYQNISPYASAWKKIQKVKDERIKYRDWFAWGHCMPAACDHTDLEDSLNEALVPAFNQTGITAKVSVQDEFCTVYNGEINISTGGYVFILVVSSLILIVIIATSVHLIYQHSFDSSKEDSSILLFFSAISNTKRLVQHEGKPDFRHLSGIKVLTMILIIFGHRVLIGYYLPFLNVEDQEKTFDFLMSMIYLNGPVVVNTFLFITGFLVFTKLLNDIEKGRTISIPLYIIYRWLRITPVYLFVLSIMIFIKAPFSNEPFFKSEAQWRIDTCTNNWWTYILFINNYYGADRECLVPAWYLAVDMQLYIVCVIIGFIMSKSKRTGYFLFGFFLAISQIIPAIIVYIKGYVPVLRFYLNYLDSYYEQDDFVNSYVPTHMRAGPYFIGALFAIILVKLREKNYRPGPWFIVIGGIYSTIATFGGLFYAYQFYLPDAPINLLESSTYVSLTRILWGTAIGMIVLTGVLQPRVKVLSILRIRLFAPLNKLLLIALLTHTLLQSETVILQRNPEFYNAFLFAWKTAGDTAQTYLISYFVHLVIEAPMARLQDFTLRKVFGGDKKS